MNQRGSKPRLSPCNCLNLRRASQALTAMYDGFLEPTGISIAQFSLLKHLEQLGPVNVSGLAAAVRLDRTTLVRSLKPLEQQGLVQDLAPRGGRDRQLSLTPAGLDRFRTAAGAWREAQTAVETAFGPEDLARFNGWLQVIERLKP